MPHPHRPPGPPPTGGLDPYRAKRSAGATPEPFGGSGLERPGLFVMHQHAARSLHWDLRLELGGTLRCWAVPKGPSLVAYETRLAVETEDHPIEYADFEGVIPAGNYGAGAMIVWDRGQWLPHEDPAAGLESGKLLFDLKGFKLRGLWTLVRTKKPREWLLIKKPDAFSTGEDAEGIGGESVLSGLTVEELAAGAGRAAEIEAELVRLGAPRRRVRPADAEPMLAEVAEGPFTKPGWIFELKYDGYRALAAVEDGQARLRYRSGRDGTATFPDLARALAALPYPFVLLDGEIAVLDDAARPSFQRLQQRARLSRRLDVERATVSLPALYFAFDLLAFGEFDLRPLPLSARKGILHRLLPRAGPVRYADHVEERGEALFAEVERAGVEGLIGKRADAPYRAGRSPAWLKIRAERRGDFAVVGFTLPKGSRAGFGALHLGAWPSAVDPGDPRGGRLLYVGRVGTGFSDRQLDDLHDRLAAAVRPDPPCDGPVPAGDEHVWVEPELVAEVRFLERTDDGLLRQPVFLRLRDDKRPDECTLDGALPAQGAGGADEPDPAPAAEPEPRPELALTRLEKVFWPDDGFTKGDLLDYYRAIAPWLLPYLRDRPVVLDRFPDGIAGKSFFQKNAPEYLPDWIRTEPVWSEDSGKETRYVVAGDAETVLYLANMGTIPLHLWSARIGSLETPDWSVVDLDAKQATFPQVIAVAQALGRLCREIELPAFVKTSGATGLHVLVPLGGRLTHEQSRRLAEILAKLVAAELPGDATTLRTVAAREGRVYVDYLQNGYGKLLVAPFSARPRPGATVSMPLDWDEVATGLDPRAFTIRTAVERMERLGRDPFAGVLEEKPDLHAALGRLAGRAGG